MPSTNAHQPTSAAATFQIMPEAQRRNRRGLGADYRARGCRRFRREGYPRCSGPTSPFVAMVDARGSVVFIAAGVVLCRYCRLFFYSS